jgi:hypothetical protein
MQLFSFQKLVEIPPDVRHVLDDQSPFRSFAVLRRGTSDKSVTGGEYPVPAPGCLYMMSSYSILRCSVTLDQIIWSSGLSTLAMERITTSIAITIIHKNRTKHLICKDPQPGRGRLSHCLQQTGECREFIACSLLRYLCVEIVRC